ncbi:hypothetical protein HPB52_008279 [Rhipicephalus sanguineus]|uniref:Secreted protein n=1 Tax=Rhipicephalus sanguineus TaxID=34632 RepID=A0A9D4PHR3_RHISA|nr:hypothetical protein HPB52_008279 [Rhipicephalus sanguineus]
MARITHCGTSTFFFISLVRSGSTSPLQGPNRAREEHAGTNTAVRPGIDTSLENESTSVGRLSKKRTSSQSTPGNHRQGRRRSRHADGQRRCINQYHGLGTSWPETKTT